MTEKTTTTPAAIEPEGGIRSGRATDAADTEGHRRSIRAFTEDAPEADGVAKAADEAEDTEGHEKR